MTATLKTPIFIGNWKMNLPPRGVSSFIEQINEIAYSHNPTIAICPPTTTVHQLTHTKSIAIGGQDCSNHDMGAHTGQISAHMLASAGCSFCIVGHSERRTQLKESNQLISEKMIRAIEATLIPIVCVGENLKEFEEKQAKNVISKQLAPIFTGLQGIDAPHAIIIAYEPVWSIGTGVIPKLDYLTDTFKILQELYKKHRLPQTSCHFLYGGSVNENNAASLLAIEGVDGLLIGGASLDSQVFQKIVSLT